jgi:hypothetical protein
MVYISSHSYPWIYEEFLGELHTARWQIPGTYWVEGWVSPIASLDAFRPQEIPCSCRTRSTRLSSLQSSNSAVWATPDWQW